MRTAALLLVGGKGVRMGGPKAELPFGDETLLVRTARTLRATVPLVVVVKAAGQEFAAPPPDVEVVEDRVPGQGPLEGLRAGLVQVADRADAVFVSAVDCPFLQTGFVTRCFELLDQYDAVVPRHGPGIHPLAAGYRTSVLPVIERRLDTGDRRVRSFFAEINTRFATQADFLDVDPTLESLNNVNTPDEYRQALNRIGKRRA